MFLCLTRICSPLFLDGARVPYLFSSHNVTRVSPSLPSQLLAVRRGAGTPGRRFARKRRLQPLPTSSAPGRNARAATQKKFRAAGGIKSRWSRYRYYSRIELLQQSRGDEKQPEILQHSV